MLRPEHPKVSGLPQAIDGPVFRKRGKQAGSDCTQVTHSAQAAHEHRGYRQDKEIDESLQKKICYDPGTAFHHETVDPSFTELAGAWLPDEPVPWHWAAR